MPDFHVLRHVLRPHEPLGSEEYDPGSEMLVIVHRNPNDPDDPTEFGHHIPLQGLAYRKEMWGLPDYASTVDAELKDLERFYYRKSGVNYGPHPLADITQHYFEAPPAQMQNFTPQYVMDRATQGFMPTTADGVARMCIDTVMSGLDDVRASLSSVTPKVFPCKGMTGLSSSTVTKRSGVMRRMGEQTRQIRLVSSAPLDAVRQLVTDRQGQLETARRQFVDHVLNEVQVPEIMRRRVVDEAARRGLIPERLKL